MSLYLRKYVGKYSVKAEYDKNTCDFPRNIKGEIDASFSDIYIPCNGGAKIVHLQRNILMACYMSIQVGHNRLKELYQNEIGSIDKFIDGNKFNFNSMYKELINKDIIVNVEETDELIFYFKDCNMDKVAKVMKPKTLACNRQPFNKKNLPKTYYEIPYEDLALYKAVFEDFDFSKVYIVNGINNAFMLSLASKKHSVSDIKRDMKLSKLKPKEFFHSIGVWDLYIKYLEKNI